MTHETSTLYEDIHALLQEAPGAEQGGAFLARLEHTLTDGYARALVLEAERVRLERRMDELTDGLRDDPADAPTDELATIARRLNDADTELSSLRGTLARLRARARAIRAS
jgi:ABC-type phosphate transport system auxiliary subunit